MIDYMLSEVTMRTRGYMQFLISLGRVGLGYSLSVEVHKQRMVWDMRGVARLGFDFEGVFFGRFPVFVSPGLFPSNSKPHAAFSGVQCRYATHFVKHCPAPPKVVLWPSCFSKSLKSKGLV